MVQVIQRIGDMLSGFSEQSPVRTLGQCAESAGITKSSAHRLLTSLEEIGLVERAANASWQLGPGVLRLAAVRMSHRTLRDEITQGLRRLGQEFEAATAFSVPNGNDLVYVERTDSPRPYAPAARLGSVHPLWRGASGRALLSAMSPDERATRLKTPEWDALDDTFRRRVIESVEESAALGYSIDDGHWFDSIAGVAVAVSVAGGPFAAASLIVAPERMTPELAKDMGTALADLVRQATKSALIAGQV